jgi:hypothetical protein
MQCFLNQPAHARVSGLSSRRVCSASKAKGAGALKLVNGWQEVGCRRIKTQQDLLALIFLPLRFLLCTKSISYGTVRTIVLRKMNNPKLPAIARRSLAIQFLCFAMMLIVLGCDADESREKALVRSKHEDSGESTRQLQTPDWPTGLSTDTIEAPSIAVEAPTRAQPITAASQIQRVSEDNGVATWNVWIKLSIARGHYIYAPDNKAGPFRPLAVEMQLPDDATNISDWKFPVSNDHSGNAVYYDSVMFYRQLRIPKETKIDSALILHYQVCNEDVCYPPAMLQLAGSDGHLP